MPKTCHASEHEGDVGDSGGDGTVHVGLDGEVLGHVWSETAVDHDEVDERPELQEWVQASAVEIPGDELDSHALDVGHEAAWRGYGVHSHAKLPVVST